MVSTVGEEELHAFADQLGLKRDWFQSRELGNASCAHYDVTRSVRLKAIKLGAVAVTGRQLVLLNYDGMRRRGLLQLHPFQEKELADLAHLLKPHGAG